MPQTTTAELTDTIPTIIEEAQFTRQFKGVMRGLSWNIRKGKGSTVNVPYFGTVTSNQLTEGVDMTSSETMQDTNVQVTPYEAGLKIILTKNVVEDDNEDLIRAAGRLLGDGYETKVDQDLLARLDNGTNSLGGAGTTMTMGQLAAARALLQGNAVSSGGPAPTPYVIVSHPFVELDIVDTLTPIPLTSAGTSGWATNAMSGPMTENILANYSVGRIFGMPFITDGNLSIDTSDDVKGGCFASGSNGAIIYVPAREPGVETEYDASLRGWELVYVGRYGVGNYLNGWTVELYHDASTPS
jgi:hypothetical protein